MEQTCLQKTQTPVKFANMEFHLMLITILITNENLITRFFTYLKSKIFNSVRGN